MSAMQMSDSPLAQAGRKFFSAADAETMVSLLRPAFHLRALEPGEQQVGYLGGDPDLPADVAWPTWDGHGPLYFVAALDCAHVPTQHLDIPLPTTGTLLFFYFDGLGENSVAYNDPDSVANGTRVLYVPEGSETAPRTRPDGAAPYPRLDLGGELIATIPDNGNPALIAAFGDPDDPIDYVDYPTTDPDGTAFWEALTAYRRDHSPHHRIGGYALPLQGQVEPEGAQALQDSGAKLVLLAQIDSDARSGMGWGDAGRLYWLIRPQDLAAGRFDRATFTWQCE
jgi:uncharacterized protein YwqG